MEKSLKVVDAVNGSSQISSRYAGGGDSSRGRADEDSALLLLAISKCGKFSILSLPFSLIRWIENGVSFPSIF